MNPHLRTPEIIVVDDEPRNLSLLEEVLSSEGYALRLFRRGDTALYSAETNPPDLILLDICMPSPNGYETCQRLKSIPHLAPIPVLFITALDRMEDKVQAFDAGAVDFITKPFCDVEILKRVEVHLKLYRLQQRLVLLNQQLEGQVRERTSQLTEANRQLAIWNHAKTDWLNMLNHELRTPLTGVLGVTDLLISHLPAASPLYNLAPLYDQARNRIMELIEDASLLTSIRIDEQAFTLHPIPAMPAIHSAMERVRARVAPTAITFQTSGDENFLIHGEPRLLQRAMEGLLWAVANCLKPDESVMVELRQSRGRIHVTLRAPAAHLSAEALDTFFEVCGQRELRRPGGDFGLAPVLGRQIVQLMNGDVNLKSSPNQGLTLDISFQHIAPEK